MEKIVKGPGRPRKDQVHKSVGISVSLPANLLDELLALENVYFVPRSRIITNLIRHSLSSLKDDEEKLEKILMRSIRALK